ncbi:MAG: DUF302 domain-containing protein [Firmicutes bacterium]|nr:DUF302 domain-containing protein [Bacillota bacterium]
MQSEMSYTVETGKSFDEAVEAVEAKTRERGFRVLHVHDVQATLAEKGLQREPLKIIEICNAKYAHQVLEKDDLISLLMPCKIVVYRKDGKTILSAMRPTMLAQFFPAAHLDDVAKEVDAIVLGIVDAAK